MLVDGSTSSPSPSFAAFSSGKTVTWWRESSSSPSPSSIAVPQAPSARYGGLQRSMAIGRGAVRCTQDQDVRAGGGTRSRLGGFVVERGEARKIRGWSRKLQAIPEAFSVRRTVKIGFKIPGTGSW
ncbi:hypothetical protein EYR40_001938 [Pleurotus pulmonarius]|nr:hypothetical protein EYR40_001938 [Pleurotus pulmonarius]